MIAAAALGVLAALGLDALPNPNIQERPSEAANEGEAARELEVAREPQIEVDREQLAAAQALRDEAERLTIAAVTTDEAAHERWLARIAKIEAVRADPDTPASLRVELDATIAALDQVGLL